MACTVCHRDIRIAAKGLCGACYQRLQKRGTTDYAPKRVRGVCSVQGCGKPHAARGYCDMHHQRVLETGDPERTKRPDDWGAKEKHPLYNRWAHIRRYRGSHPISPEWDDFLQFVVDVGQPPSAKAMLYAANDTKPLGPDNFVWKLAITQRVEGEDEATYRRRRSRAYRHLDAERFAAYDLKKHYGLSRAEYERLHAAQNGKCKICGRAETQKIRGKPFRLAVDHCHSKGAIRGLLCRQCNTGLGAFNDDVELLSAAIAYLKLAPHNRGG